MNCSFTAIMLAGGMRPPPLGRDLGLPVLTLPVTPERSLLRLWIESLERVGGCRSLVVVVSSQEEAAALDDHMNGWEEPEDRADTMVCVEPRKWRGTAGILRDVSFRMPESELVMLVEGVCLPPPRIHLLLEAMDETAIAAVGVGSGRRAAGAYAFRRAALERISTIGFVDVKEQLLPELYRSGHAARAVDIVGQVVRLRDRAGYLTAVAAQRGGQPKSGYMASSSPRHRIARSARVSESLLGKNVVVSEHAFVTESVLLDNSHVGPGAVVNRSVVGPNAAIAEGRVLSDAVESPDGRETGAIRREAPGEQSTSARFRR